jgi:hypothetical protein
MLMAVDLAAKYSAACVMDDDGSIYSQFDSWSMTEDQFIWKLAEPWFMGKFVMHGQTEWLTGPPEVLVIEDLPHMLFKGGNTNPNTLKKVCRLHGRIEEKMIQADAHDKVIFLPPATWLRSYGIKTMKDAAKQVQPKAEELGYVPPLDYTVYKGTDRVTARKVNTDYCAAFLIARWALTYKQDSGTYDEPTTARF